MHHLLVYRSIITIIYVIKQQCHESKRTIWSELTGVSTLSMPDILFQMRKMISEDNLLGENDPSNGCEKARTFKSIGKKRYQPELKGENKVSVKLVRPVTCYVGSMPIWTTFASEALRALWNDTSLLHQLFNLCGASEARTCSCRSSNA